MVTLYSRITKLGWYDLEKNEFVFRNVMDDVNKFLGGRFKDFCDTIGNN